MIDNTKKILLAEDSQSISYIIKKALENKGFEVVTAFDGITALEKAYSEFPDGILLDIHMPLLSGLQVLRLLKAQSLFKDIPMLILTGEEEGLYLHWTHTLGADGYLVKPRDINNSDETIATIAKFFKTKCSPKDKKPQIDFANKDQQSILAYAFESLYQNFYVYTTHYKFKEKISESQNLQEMAQKTLQILREIFGNQLYFILIYQDKEPFLCFMSPFGIDSPEIQACTKIATHRFQQLHRNSSHSFATYVDKIDNAFDLDMQKAQKLMVPICHSNCHHSKSDTYEQSFQCSHPPLGMLGIISPHTLIDEVERALIVIAKSISNSWETFSLKEEMKALEPIKAYSKLLQIINSSDNLDEMLEFGIHEIVHFSQSQAAIFFQLDGDSHNLVVKSSYGVSDVKLLTQIIPVGKGLVGKVAEQKKHLHITSNDALSIEIDTGFGKICPKELVLLPVIFQENILGVLALASIQSFHIENIEHTFAMVRQFAIGIHNHLNYQQVRELADTLEKHNESLKIQYEEIQSQQRKILKQRQELDKKNKALEESDKHKSAFFAAMSHELRTPLNIIIGYTSLTLKKLKKDIDEKSLKNLQKAKQAANGLLALINDVLDFSKIEAGSMTISFEDLNIEKLLKDSTIIVEGLTLKKDIEFKLELAENLPIIVSDSTKITQILTNLLSNAVKFTQKGYVALRTKVDNGNVYIEIEDTGCGISERKLDNIFEPFKQADSSIKKRFGGTGLGLAISKKFCDMLGIELGVNSKEGQGSRFWLTIPAFPPGYDRQKNVKRPPNKSSCKKITSQELKSKLQTQDTFAAIGIKSILVIDDTKDNLDLMDLVFEETGCKIYMASSGQQGIDLAKTAKPDMVIVDLAMPGMDGFEVISSLRNSPHTANMILIACSAFSTIEFKERALQVGGNGYIPKPIQPENFLRQIKEIALKSQVK